MRRGEKVVFFVCGVGRRQRSVNLAPGVDCSRIEGQPAGACEAEIPQDDLSSLFLSTILKFPPIRWGYWGFFRIHLVASWKKAAGGS